VQTGTVTPHLPAWTGPAGTQAGAPAARRRAGGWLQVPVWREAAALTQRRVITTDPLWQEPPLDAAGMPVLLVGGLFSTPALLAPLADLLDRCGCRCVIAPVRFGIGCGEATARRVEESLERLVETRGQPAMVIAHSRGGQFGRAVAVRRPELVKGLITLGSPLTRLLAVHPLLRAQIGLLGLAGGLGIGGLLRPGCLWGDCCAQLRADIDGPFPAAVRFLSVYSRQDAVVDWHSCLDAAARTAQVSASHAGLLWSPTSLAVIVRELAQTLDTATVEHGRQVVAS
jgi:triacylglycerol lipase